MGFLEGLRRKKESEREIAIQEHLRTQKTSEEMLQAKEEEQKRTRQLVDAARAQFGESGIKILIDELLEIERGLRFVEVVNFYHKEESYRCEIILKDLPKSENHYSDEMRVSIGIDVTHDGTITFNGDPKKGSSVISRQMWINNKPSLENALGKAYTNPLRTIHSPSKSSETAGPGM